MHDPSLQLNSRFGSQSGKIEKQFKRGSSLKLEQTKRSFDDESSSAGVEKKSSKYDRVKHSTTSSQMARKNPISFD